MGIFNRSDDMDFDAYESDNSKIILIVVMVCIGIGLVIGIIFGIYYYINLPDETPNQNITFNGNVTAPGKVIVDFDGVNMTVDENPTGIYYYHTQEVIDEEICTANNQKIDCIMLTTSYCEDRDCRKEVKTRIECYVNQKRVDCPEGFE